MTESQCEPPPEERPHFTGRPARGRAGGGRRAGRRVVAARSARGGRDHARASAARGFRRLLDQRRAAAGAGLGRPPREVAQRLGEELEQRLGASLERFEVAGPGFLNLFLADSLAGRRRSPRCSPAGEAFGAGGADRAERILVEFVSANPTGPMHVGHARNAAYGDALARVLAFTVTRSSASSTSTTPARRCASSGESIRALARGEEVARGRLPGRLRRAARRPSRGRLRRWSRPSWAAPPWR